jgi:DNA-binding CsgD family transcriptional regulator
MIEIDSSSNSRKNASLYHKEREKKVLELYHVQGKTTRDIQRELEMSPNTITDILKRDREEKEKEKKETSVYKVGDDNGSNGDARSRPTNPIQQQAMTPVSSQPPQQPITTTTTTPATTVGFTAAEAESLSPGLLSLTDYTMRE